METEIFRHSIQTDFIIGFDFEPIEKFGHHIILLGVEIIIVTLKGSDVLLCKEEIHQKLNCKKILKEE